MSEPFASSPPPPPPGGSSPAGNPIPWEDRQRLGFVKALLDNAKLFITAPQEAYRRTRESGDYGSPILWVVILALVVGLLRWAVSLVFTAPMLPFMPAGGMEGGEAAGAAAAMALVAGGGFVGAVIIGPIMAVVGLFIWAAIVHLCLMMLSALGSSRAGFEGSVRALAYTQIASIVQIVPFVGPLIALVWTIYLATVGISTLHRTTQGKAVAAVLIPIAVCCVCIVAAIAIFGAAIFAAISGAAAGNGG
jgi:hypothetical protein